jgi:hypothetical protein
MGTQVVLHRLWRVAFTRVSVHVLPIAVTVGLLFVNAKLLLKGQPLTSYERFALQSAAKFHVSL